MNEKRAPFLDEESFVEQAERHLTSLQAVIPTLIANIDRLLELVRQGQENNQDNTETFINQTKEDKQ